MLLAVEAAAGRHKTLLAEGSVLDTLQQHRLAELRSTGEPDGSVAGSAQECPLSGSYSQVRHWAGVTPGVQPAHHCCGCAGTAGCPGTGKHV